MYFDFRIESSWLKIAKELYLSTVPKMGKLTPGGVDGETLFEGNAANLSSYIESALKSREEYTDIHIDTIDIIVHSMGGLISRRYLSETRAGWAAINNSRHVDNLIMLATPNTGSKRADVKKFIPGLANKPCPGPASKELAASNITVFNSWFSNFSGSRMHC